MCVTSTAKRRRKQSRQNNKAKRAHSRVDKGRKKLK